MNSYEYDNWYLAGHSLGGAMDLAKQQDMTVQYIMKMINTTYE